MESLIHQLGRFDLAKSQWSWIPQTWLHFKIFSFKKGDANNTGFSPSQARLLALLLSSFLHGMFFVMMGTRGSFWVLFCAYALAAFARSILTGEILITANIFPRVDVLFHQRHCEYLLCFTRGRRLTYVKEHVFCRWSQRVTWICIWLMEWVTLYPRLFFLALLIDNPRLGRSCIALSVSSCYRQRSAVVPFLLWLTCSIRHQRHFSGSYIQAYCEGILTRS